MLDTVLQIGKIFREAGRLEQHRYIKPAPEQDPKNPITYLSIPVDDDGSIQFDQAQEVTDNNKIQSWYYLNFKTSDSDSLKRYIFGDIYRSVTIKSGKLNEDGNFRLGNPESGAASFRVNSFQRGENDALSLKNEKIHLFRASFIKHEETLLQLFEDYPQIFIHFDFQNKQWHELKNEIHIINRKLLDSFIEETSQGYVLQKALFKTLSTSSSNTPNFQYENKVKNKLFTSVEEIFDLFYGIDFSQKSLIRKGSIKIVVLPRGNNLSAQSIEDFFEADWITLQEAEEKITQENTQLSVQDSLDDLFGPIITKASNEMSQFDVVFSIASSSPSSPDTDVIEIAGLEKSLVQSISNNIKNKRITILSEANQIEKIDLLTKKRKLNIFSSFSRILGDVTKDKKKYQSHLLKVLPQIYTGTYKRDDLLLPAFIDKVQFNIRNEAGGFHFLKYDYYFLLSIRNTKGDPMQEMFTSPSYKIGVLLGQMAKPLSMKINSFEKNYVGQLSKRIAHPDDLIRFANFINEKLTIHNALYTNLKNNYLEIRPLLDELQKTEKYNKHYCSFGFFEGYFKRFEKTEEETESSPENKAINLQ